jgi:hypothetical protein
MIIMSFGEIMLLRLRSGGSIGLHPMYLLLTVVLLVVVLLHRLLLVRAHRLFPTSFNLITEFFLRLKKNYQGVKTKKLRSLQGFEWKINESLREAYTRMRRLIAVTQGVTEAQAVQFWYGILDKEL